MQRAPWGEGTEEQGDEAEAKLSRVAGREILVMIASLHEARPEFMSCVACFASGLALVEHASGRLLTLKGGATVSVGEAQLAGSGAYWEGRRRPVST